LVEAELLTTQSLHSGGGIGRCVAQVKIDEPLYAALVSVRKRDESIEVLVGSFDAGPFRAWLTLRGRWSRGGLFVGSCAEGREFGGGGKAKDACWRGW